MKFGPFVCLPGQLVIAELQSVETWEHHSSDLFAMQKNVPWWLGDFVVYGEARFGDEFWQAVPEDIDVEMLNRFASVSRKIPPQERVPELSWMHHSIALRIKDKHLRKAAIQVALKKRMNCKEFGKHIERYG